MAFSAAKNQILFERVRDFAKAAQNLREEAVRIKNIKDQEAQGHADHDDTEIATVAELDTMISYLTDFLAFNDGSGAGAFAVARWGWLVPFVDTTPA